ncbi:hypothetical protein, partial [Frankia sp. EI5c]|uniref:hypothetical protein n=1 Tax=Frankia sp. EI5c TaxID=683316 RepID=UPI001A7F01E5
MADGRTRSQIGVTSTGSGLNGSEPSSSAVSVALGVGLADVVGRAVDGFELGFDVGEVVLPVCV